MEALIVVAVFIAAVVIFAVMMCRSAKGDIGCSCGCKGQCAPQDENEHQHSSGSSQSAGN